ncbi:MAG: RluA family pseudouridine synthase [Flavobacteriales bacterium]
MEELWSDAHFLAVHKPAGMPVQADKTGDVSVIETVRTQWQDQHIDALPGLAHRLDRPVSGVLLLTRTAEALTAINVLFARHAVRKTYWAVVAGVPPDSGVWKHRLVHDPHKHKAYVARPEQQAVDAELHYKRLAKGDRYSLLELVPAGGSFHQLRAQCAAAGFPIKGDVKYGARRGEQDRSIGLHARSLEFVHPFTGVKQRVEAPPPSAPLWKALLNMAGQTIVPAP